MSDELRVASYELRVTSCALDSKETIARNSQQNQPIPKLNSSAVNEL